LQQYHGVRRFELERSCCFSAMLLDEERGRLFVGAKNFLLSLSLDNIAKQEHKIYWPAPVDWREECNWAGKDITPTVITHCTQRRQIRGLWRCPLLPGPTQYYLLNHWSHGSHHKTESLHVN
ncbi:hypothetical protein CHARACLAT_026948, partial [Characodon lateralis]|nr:hypothetical protein [Characodon lateralis]